MPLYDYECESCSHKLLDVKQSFEDDPLSLCPECGEPSLNRVISGGAYAFVKGVNTVGNLADKNTKNNESLIQENQQRIKESQPSTNSSKPWYSQYATATNKEVSKMTNKQKAEYILKGKK